MEKNIDIKIEYKELTGRDFTIVDIVKETDSFIEKIKSLDFVSNFDFEVIQDVLTSIKRSLYGVQISTNIKKLNKAVNILKRIISEENIEKEISDLCKFFSKLTQNSIDNIENAKDKSAWKKSVNRESWKK